MMRTCIPPPIYALVTAGVLWLLDRYTPQLRVSGGFWSVAGWGLTVIGILLPLISAIVFMRKRTTINPMHPDRASRLVVSGIFSVSRNPMYLGLVCSLAGWALLLGSPLGLLVVWLFVRLLVIVQIAPEESALRRRFGTAYADYTDRVHRWMGRRRS